MKRPIQTSTHITLAVILLAALASMGCDAKSAQSTEASGDTVVADVGNELTVVSGQTPATTAVDSDVKPWLMDVNGYLMIAADSRDAATAWLRRNGTHVIVYYRNDSGEIVPVGNPCTLTDPAMWPEKVRRQ